MFRLHRVIYEVVRVEGDTAQKWFTCTRSLWLISCFKKKMGWLCNAFIFSNHLFQIMLKIWITSPRNVSLSCRLGRSTWFPTPIVLILLLLSQIFFNPVSTERGEHVATTGVVSKGQGKAPLWECVTLPCVFKTLPHLVANLFWPCFTVQVGYKAGQ